MELIKVRKHGKGDVLLADANQIKANKKVLIPVGQEVPEDVETENSDEENVPKLSRKDMAEALRAVGQKVSNSLSTDDITAMFIEHCSA